ncbi:MAG TPA: sensor histidine kinase [Hyphomicrobiaceae bacterium]|nr:sensor histidine kinase [Hyphomicrobiaceae bacterium]
MKLNSLYVKLLLSGLAWTIIVLPLAGFLIDRRHKQEVLDSFDDKLFELLLQMHLSSENLSGIPVPARFANDDNFQYRDSGWYWQITPKDGAGGKRILSESLAGKPIRLPSELGAPLVTKTTSYQSIPGVEIPLVPGVPRFNDQFTGTFVRLADAKGPGSEPIRIIEAILNPSPQHKDIWYSYAIAGRLDQTHADIARFRRELVWAFGFVGLALAVLMFASFRFILRPLRQIEDGLGAIRSGDAQRLEALLPAEVEPLREQVNALIVSNQEIIERARRQVGNLAHALKTPLAVIINEANESKTPFAIKVSEQAAVMRDQVNRYLDRARIAALVGVVVRSTDVKPVADSIIAVLEQLHDDKALDIVATGDASARFQGEKQDLEELIGNLLDNACKWARSRITLDMQVRSAEGAKRLVLTVDDDGKGLTAEQRAQGVKRGRRLDETKPGSGLGLTIVSDLIETYRGAFQLDESPLGGLRVIVELPAT